jgi:starvation-inducible DNA-binding protein
MRHAGIESEPLRFAGRNRMANDTATKARTAAQPRRTAKLHTPSSLGAEATRDLGAALNALAADLFALYLKTKNFHWHVSGPHFRDYHLLLDEQADQILATVDPAAERVRKLGGTTLRSIGHIARLQRVADNDADYVTPLDMLAELREDNTRLADRMRELHGVCDEYGDVASASLLEVWIDEAERRAWFLFETTRHAETPGTR